jgi:NAD(P)-dependent dehydrogenase (short-subunit alcohol dehydrogenase family)
MTRRPVPRDTSTSSVVLVTGAARGIGAGVAEVLASEGRALALVDRLSCEAVLERVRGHGIAAEAYTCDIRNWDDCHRVVEQAEENLGPLRGCAAVAGVFEAVPFLKLDPASWRRTMDVNADGTFHTCHAAAEAIVRNGGGAIVCVSSNAASLAWDDSAHYSASKAAVNALVRAMAFELGPLGVRVNAILPGTVRSPLNELERQDPNFEISQARACPLRRIGEPSDIAHAVAFLLDEQRAAWITGQLLTVDGGYGTHGEGTSDFGLTASEFEPAEQ